MKGCVAPAETQVRVFGPVQMLRAWQKKRWWRKAIVVLGVDDG
jgi:hypothetical protein